MALRKRLQIRARELKREIVALHFALRDPRTPWHAKALIACVVAYVLSPIDLIPDPIPILGYLDDLILVPLGIYFALKLIPEQILADCRRKASATDIKLPRSLAAGIVIGILWVAAVILIGGYLLRFFQ